MDLILQSDFIVMVLSLHGCTPMSITERLVIPIYSRNRELAKIDHVAKTPSSSDPAGIERESPRHRIDGSYVRYSV
jgi:hypothetical protein